MHKEHIGYTYKPTTYQDHVEYKHKTVIRHRPEKGAVTSDVKRRCRCAAKEGKDSTSEFVPLEGRKIDEKAILQNDTSCGTDSLCDCHQEDNGSKHGPVNHPSNHCQGKHDPVNHPSHYCQGGIECIDAIQAAVTGLNGPEAWLTGSIIKYIWRWKWKNGKEDLHKARFYLNKLIMLVEGKSSSEQANTHR